ncbi:hypothetical protein CCZ01_07745 [Helicobacter monodelphidis]|uniref:7-carboxy-7-deazaguanine synthase QueE n=1 Tax=Helicobacter sp. 15-1451 TaxID=2004995 RepID=UPI000DCE5171|nr:7-carboxy-7-deazaguanine synthase QueE [Helicobacter sp. 15-1451]RAX56937.1 hypothetical protein CCZ01_07745 [Helicobacter sp. 15-1451]
MSETKIYSIREIFYSLQGEGFHSGKAAIFVRFSQCNLRCDFCDTEFDTILYRYNKEQLEHHIQEILNKAKITQKPLIIFSGGEPTLQLVEEESLCDGFYRCIESNGFKLAPSWIEWVTISPKTKNIPQSILARMQECKFLYPLFSFDEIQIYLQQYPHKHYCIQGIDRGDKAYLYAEFYKEMVEFCKKNPQVRLSVQLHKILQIE